MGMLHVNYTQFFIGSLCPGFALSQYLKLLWEQAAMRLQIHQIVQRMKIVLTAFVYVAMDILKSLENANQVSSNTLITYQQLTSLQFSTIKGMEMVCVVLEHQFEFILPSNFTNEQNICQ